MWKFFKIALKLGNHAMNKYYLVSNLQVGTNK